MGILDRVVLSLYALALTVISFLTLLVTFGWELPTVWTRNIMTSSSGRTTVGIVSSLIFLAGIRFIYYAFKKVPDQAVIHDSDMGEVRISLMAVKSLVSRVVSKIPGVREVKTRVHLSKGKTGIWVALDVKAALDANLPDLSDKIQKTTASYVRDIVGVTVETVKVTVSDISMDPRR
ncbi:MAG TPA: alkaline shock response membrane anchor protein AmaP [Firmicutes bacterium]|nr:alkaline shock response membrane anchor protein AmaP [Candidatus Fermentithermobacillaceae bacterium]